MRYFDLNSLLRRFARLGVQAQDAEEVRLQKSLLVIGSVMFMLAGLVWGVTYISLGEALAGLIPLFYATFSFLSLVLFSLTPNYNFFHLSQLTLVLILPFMLMATLGGFVNSSAVIISSLVCPLGALLFADRRTATRKGIPR